MLRTLLFYSGEMTGSISLEVPLVCPVDPGQEVHAAGHRSRRPRGPGYNVAEGMGPKTVRLTSTAVDRSRKRRLVQLLQVTGLCHPRSCADASIRYPRPGGSMTPVRKDSGIGMKKEST